MATTNPCKKLVTKETAHEVWQTNDGRFTIYVLKKYKNPESEAKDPYAKWFVCTISDLSPNGESGDSYVSEVKHNAHLIDNPLTDKQTTVPDTQ